MLRKLVCWSWFVLVGCGDGDDPARDLTARGSAACHEYQDALCDKAERCDGTDEQVSECRRQVAGLSCNSDQQASGCAQQLTDSSCTGVAPVGCALQQLADPAPAVAACGRFRAAHCASVERCEQVPVAECLAAPTIATLCDDVIIYTLAFEQCLEDVEARSCASSELPAACSDVFLR